MATRTAHDALVQYARSQGIRLPRSASADTIAARIRKAPGPSYAGDSACGPARVAPNQLHKVWIGARCPPLSELVSVLSAASLLQPERIIYWRTHELQHCELDECLAQLPGFELRRLDWQASPPHPFVTATRSFRVAYKINTTLKRTHLADILRLYSVHRDGGYYLDGDAFVLSPRFLDVLTCPFVLSSDVLDAPNGEFMPATSLDFPVNLTVPTPAQAVVRACGGIFSAVANSSFGAMQWARFNWSKWRYADADTSDWPVWCAKTLCKKLAMRISTALRPAIRTFDKLPGFTPRLTWTTLPEAERRRLAEELVRGAVAAGAHAIHLTWWAQREKAGQALPLLRAILDHVLRTPLLHPAHRRCAALASKLVAGRSEDERGGSA